ncbi:MAG: hypothetical protein ACFFFK_07970 [Candidatus Thorarchaeota archaeon]
MMGEKSQLQHLVVAVDSSKLARCTWCGTLESNHWINGKHGMYCSKACKSATVSEAGFVPLLFICQIGLIAIGFMYSIEIGLVFGVFLIPVGILSLNEFKQGVESAHRIPRGSRRTENVDDIKVLKTILKHVECPNCDGNIDLTTVGQDHIYHCGYCGASGIVEIAFTGMK